MRAERTAWLTHTGSGMRGPAVLWGRLHAAIYRRFVRSERAERVGKSPAELLSGQEHSHWLEILGHQRFRRAA